MNWRRFLNRAQADAEQQEELESYLEITTEEYIAQGMGVDEARLGARRKLGNLTRIREEVYEMNTATFIDTTVQELRHALRRLRLNPAFSITAILTLALGIGADTAVFSVVNKVLIQPLNYPKPEQLVALRQLAPGAAGLASFSDGLPPSPSMYVTYSEHNQTFQSLGIWNSGTANVTGLAEPEQVRIVSISDGVLQALDVPPAVGRSLLPDDYRLIGAPDFFGSGFTRTVLLSYGYWKRRFGGDKSAIGRTIRVDERPREIAGVMPQGFRMVNAEFDLIVPLAFDRSRLTLGGFGFNGVGRLKSGVTVTQANADLARLVPAWMDSWTKRTRHQFTRL